MSEIDISIALFSVRFPSVLRFFKSDFHGELSFSLIVVRGITRPRYGFDRMILLVFVALPLSRVENVSNRILVRFMRILCLRDALRGIHDESV